MNYVRTAMLLAFMTALFMVVGYAIGGGTGMFIALIAAAATNLFSYWNSDKMVLRMYNAREVNAQTAPEYYNLVMELAHRAQLPQPRVYIIDTDQPNAFATGRNPENAAVAATSGLLQALSHDELAGVMAHELAHVRNRDILTMTITATIAGAISMLGNIALFSSMTSSRNEEEGGHGLGGIGTLLAMVVAPFAAMLVQMTISRTREYEADKGGAEISGNPLALVSALQKISGGVTQNENEEAEHNPATAPMFIMNPLRGKGADNLFSTHPSLENRIAALRKIAATMQNNGGTSRRNTHMNAPFSAKTAEKQSKKQARPKWLRK